MCWCHLPALKTESEHSRLKKEHFNISIRSYFERDKLDSCLSKAGRLEGISTLRLWPLTMVRANKNLSPWRPPLVISEVYCSISSAAHASRRNVPFPLEAGGGGDGVGVGVGGWWRGGGRLYRCSQKRLWTNREQHKNEKAFFSHEKVMTFHPLWLNSVSLQSEKE